MTSTSGNLRELELKISSLEKQNFDLKMQIYYLNQKLAEVSSKHESPEKLGLAHEDRFVDNLTLKREHEAALSRISDLEYEVQRLTMATTSNHDSSFRPVLASSGSSMMQIEENRRRDRQAALLIAEQDAAMINTLESEIFDLRTKHERDVALINECTERMGNLMKEKEEADRLITLQAKNAETQQIQIDNFAEQLRRRELLLERKSVKERAELENVLSNRKDIEDEKREQAKSMTSPSLGAENFLQFSAHAAWDEMQSLRRENETLKGQLSQERERFKAQEDALKCVQASAEEITLLEAEEIARLEAELDRCLDERERMQKKCKASEAKNELLQQTIARYERHDAAGDMGSLSGDVERAFFDGGRHGGPGGPPSYLNRKSDGRKKEKEVEDDKIQLRTVEMYRQREAELLRALEGVVRRCQELESRGVI